MRLQPTLKLESNFKINDVLLNDVDSIYSDLRGLTNLSDAIDSVCKLIDYAELVDVKEWQSVNHVKLKQMTMSNYLHGVGLLPEPLATCWAECLYFNEYNSILVKMVAHLVRKTKVEGKFISVTSYKTIFNSLSTLCKKNCENWSGIDLGLLTDLDLFVCYTLTDRLTADEIIPVVAEWGGPDFEQFVGNPLARDRYETTIMRSCLERLNKATSAARLRNVSLSQFVKLVKPWMTDGSSKGVRVDIGVGGRAVKSNAKKQVLALKYTTKQLVMMCRAFNYNHETLSVSEKIEPGRKHRLIISAHFIQQIRLAYVEYCLTTIMKHAFPEIWMLQGPKKQLQIQKTMLDLAKDPKYMCFPMDASKFDQFVSKTEVSTVFLAIRQATAKFANHVHSDFFNMIDLSLLAFFQMRVVFSGKQILRHWAHGVPSGVRWTSLLDSVINCLRFDACKFHLRQFGLKPPISFFQGDDMAVFIRRNVDALLILAWYDMATIPVHPSKNFLTFHTMEFLRKIYTPMGQSGYQNRVIPKFCFRLPENKGARDTQSMLNDRIVNISRMSARSGNYHLLLDKGRLLLSKILMGQNLNDMTVLTTPSFLGGFGVVPYKSKYSARTKRLLVQLTWAKPDEQQVNLSLTGIYAENLLDLNLTYDISSLPLLESGLKESLNPTPSVTFSNKITTSQFLFKFNAGVNLKINFARGVPALFRPWMPVDEMLSMAVPDLIDLLCRESRYDDLRSITHERALPTFDLYRIKTTKSWFNAWLRTRESNLSFLNNKLDDQQRKWISSVVLGTLWIRRVKTHVSSTTEDYDNLVLASYFYICQNIDFVIDSVIDIRLCD